MSWREKLYSSIIIIVLFDPFPPTFSSFPTLLSHPPFLTVQWFDSWCASVLFLSSFLCRYSISLCVQASCNPTKVYKYFVFLQELRVEFFLGTYYYQCVLTDKWMIASINLLVSFQNFPASWSSEKAENFHCWVYQWCHICTTNCWLMKRKDPILY